MARIDTNALALHLEVALTCTPQDTLNALQDPDRYQRRRAVVRLADHLAHRLQCFDIAMADGRVSGVADDGQPELIGCE